MSAEIKACKLPYELGDVNPANILQLRTVNATTLPVKYTDKFYRELIDNYTAEYMKFCFWNGFVVGAVCARLEGRDTESCKLYIMTINVLAPYRRKGIGALKFHRIRRLWSPNDFLFVCIASELLKFVLNKAKADPTIQEVYLHVQLGNDEAKNFYLHHGFVEDGIIKDYYKRIDPPDCYILKMKLRDV